MKEPPLSRRRRPSTSAANQSKKLKLLISFNGAFRLHPPTGNVRYVGGETRIVSLDRNAGFSKLRSKVSDLCPNASSFSLRYQYHDSESSRSDSDERPLVLIDSEDDFRCMIDEYDKFVRYDDRARLRVFVCTKSSMNCEFRRQNAAFAPRGERDGSSAARLHETVYGGNGLPNQRSPISSFGFLEVAVNLPTTVKTAEARFDNDLPGKLAFKRQSRIKQSALVSSACNRTETDTRPGGRPNYVHPLIDMSPGAHVPIRENVGNQSYNNRFHGGSYNNLGKVQLGGGETYSNWAKTPASRAHPLNPRDGNLRVGTKNYTHCLSMQPKSVAPCAGTSPNMGISRQLKNSGKISPHPGFDVKQDLRSNAQASVKGLKGENSVPWTPNYDSAKTAGLAIDVCNTKSSSSSNRTLFDGRSGSHDHRVNDAKHQKIYPNGHNNKTQMENHKAPAMNENVSIAKCNYGLQPVSDMSNQGLSIKSNDPNTWGQETSCLEQSSQVTVRILDPSLKLNEDKTLFNVQTGHMEFRKPVSPGDSQNKNLNPNEFCLPYYDKCVDVGQQSFESYVSVLPPLPCLKAMENQGDLLNEAKSHGREVPCLSGNFHKFDKYGEPSHCELQMEHFSVNPQTNGVIHCWGNKAGFVSNSKLPDEEASAGSCNNSKIEPPPEFSSCASAVLSEPLQKLQPNCRLLMDEEKACDPQGDRLSAYTSMRLMQNVELQKIKLETTQDPKSTLYFVKKAEARESKKCSKVIAGISSDLIAFCTHLVTRELQTIYSSDLEYIKEIGSGTYGAVFYGKWKGSDVAIKKIKHSCLNDSLLEEQRLIADFWKEAYILGQLHHPNIVALYGIVSDGPATNLATVTEYMVNGSLKQVLQRKDRTIDRRKRLIIAMDAAFGMEYLHEKNIVHFDLKSHNLLVNMRDPQRPICKVL
ncbi:uncharacterized protein LOC111014405 isoform X2 [Momordica charantia]|uniref:Uncharacterized protein LOC111014405 isoform X2 n=1 Tax=Momordica charantia TaxID=3673 RepID=A0A6J1CUA4_MOMCH|nr:uncharacterized protein LOC111014405 isoform X2 [Momordica charantia]